MPNREGLIAQRSSVQIQPRSVRIVGRTRARDRAECGTVGSAYDGRPLSLAAAARDPRWMGQPPPTGGHRVPRGGEPRPQGAAQGAARPVDRRPAPTSRGEGPATRSSDPEAGRDHRDTRHDPALAPVAPGFIVATAWAACCATTIRRRDRGTSFRTVRGQGLARTACLPAPANPSRPPRPSPG